MGSYYDFANTHQIEPINDLKIFLKYYRHSDKFVFFFFLDATFHDFRNRQLKIRDEIR